MHFISEDLEAYVALHSQEEPSLLKQLDKETYQKVLLPRMLSGHFQGRVLSMLSKLIQPRNILEVGTYTGYSALCLCEGMLPDGCLHTIDIKEELLSFQRKYFDASPWGNQITQHLGEALEIIPKLDIIFDLAFIDADKENYINYYELIVPKMNKGGVIITDNVLWSGKVIEPLKEGDNDTKVLLEYNKMINQDTRVETVLLPIRDGLTITRVK